MPAQPVLPPFFANLSAVGLPLGTVLAPGSRVAAYVRSAALPDDTDFIRENRVPTIQQACLKVRSGQSDVIVVLEGHTESISTADFFSNLRPGTKIVSAGTPGASNNATLTWTATASTVLLDVANVALVGFNLNFAGIDAVVAPITLSAAGCLVANNLVTLAAGSAGATTPFTVAAGANNCVIRDNKMLQTGTQTEVNVISITGAVDNLEIFGNKISCLLTSATGGVIQIGAAATNLDIHDNLLYNAVEDGIGIRVADTFAATGWIYNNNVKGIDAGGTVAQNLKAVSFEGTTESLIGCFNNQFTDEAVSSGILAPPIGTT